MQRRSFSVLALALAATFPACGSDESSADGSGAHSGGFLASGGSSRSTGGTEPQGTGGTPAGGAVDGSSGGLQPGAGGSVGGASTSGGTSGGGSAPLCESGQPDTDWPSDCDTRPRATCTPGTWSVYDPTGADQMPAVQTQSEHFALRWEGQLVSAQAAQATLSLFEDIWGQIVGRIGFVEPFCDSAEKFKVNVHVRPDGGFTGSGVQGVPAMWVEAGGIDNRGLLGHEFTHTLQYASGGFRDSPYVGWMWESQADWMNHQQLENRGNLDCAGRAPSLANFPHMYYGSTRNRYCNWQFWEFLKDKHCYSAIADMWLKSPRPSDAARTTEDPFSVLARNMGWSASELNDFFGLWAMHNVTWDYRDPDGTDQGQVYRQAWGYSEAELRAGSPSQNQRLRVTRLEELDATQRRYHVPKWWAPQRWGYNLVRLHPTSEADGTVTVTFRGVVQESAENEDFAPYQDTPKPAPKPDSDWRWGLVAVDAQGLPRYSSLQHGSDGSLCFEHRASDTELWLVVVATPTTIQKILWDQKYFSVYRYPWMVELVGTLPEGFEPGAPKPSPSGAPHPNGGGWVATEANVAPTAYVGPYAAVLGGTVSGNARIEDQALIVSGEVSENAVIGGLTILGGGLKVSGNAVLRATFQSPGTFEPGQSLSGSAQLLGDLELRGEGISLSSGVYYGYVEPSHSTAPAHGANQTVPMTEVTSSAPPTWRP